MNPIDVERQLAYSVTPESKRKEREKLQKDVEKYLAAGKEIKQVGATDEQRTN